jgi:hypothetical protein
MLRNTLAFKNPNENERKRGSLDFPFAGNFKESERTY